MSADTDRPPVDPLSLSIITFPHPGLRYLAKPIRRVDADLKLIAARMFELMYEHRGVGLAATQVNLPLRLFVMNPSGEKGVGTETVVINPVLSRARGNEEAEEGCLSLPNVHGNVIRAKTIHLNGFTLNGQEIKQDLSGFEARIAQHETDHLDGVLFLDRLKEGAVMEEAAEIEALALEYQSRQRIGEVPADAELLESLAAWEIRYC
jgi:peptide deformylase